MRHSYIAIVDSMMNRPMYCHLRFSSSHLTPSSFGVLQDDPAFEMRADVIVPVRGAGYRNRPYANIPYAPSAWIISRRHHHIGSHELAWDGCEARKSRSISHAIVSALWSMVGVRCHRLQSNGSELTCR